MKNLLFSHPTGNANVRGALEGLYNAGLLYEFDTAIAVFQATLLDRISSCKLFSELKRRNFDGNLQSITRSYPWYETARLISIRAGLKSLTKHETGRFCIDEVYKHHDMFVSKRIIKEARHLQAVYSYEDGSLRTFETAQKNGMQTFYDLPIGYWRSSQKILEEETRRWPEWASTMVGVKNSKKKLERKDNELKLADKIFVASSFTAKTLEYYPATLNEICIIPYGFPYALNEKIYEPLNDRKLRLLFVGGLSQRKGIADLFYVAGKFNNDIELTVVGKKPADECPALENALSNCKYIPTLPHHKILELMKHADVFVFPSTFEGFGLVITEAMSQGTPVITTYNTAGPDFIENGKNGWLINAGNTSELETCVEHLLNNTNEIALAGMAARKTAMMRPWSVYGMELANRIQSFL